MSSLVHPANPAWRIRPHPASHLARRVCHIHSPNHCPGDGPTLSVHRVAGSWSPEEREAFPEWTWDRVYICDAAPHICGEACTLEQQANAVNPSVSILERIAYFHGSAAWDDHWEREPRCRIDDNSDLLRDLDEAQIALVHASLAKIQAAYERMNIAGYFVQVAAFYDAIFFSPTGPPRPTSAFGAGFSGYDRLDKQGQDRAGYTSTAEHSVEQWEYRTTYQIAYFLALGRIFKLPAGHLIAYDPCYSIVDIVILAALGIRALRKTDPGRAFLRVFTTPTLFYAPGAEQAIVGDAILRTPNITHLLIDCADVSWCLEDFEDEQHPRDLDFEGADERYPGNLVKHFVANYTTAPIPQFHVEITPGEREEAPCGQHMLQWIPEEKVAAFQALRGAAREPSVRMLMFPDGRLESED
ncbi:hypothetical protein C8F01DRAFT_1234060 [Mycena amicta]|nr:hypothetical protein C8F01DRAFT_1234060 [Mycena amicta]